MLERAQSAGLPINWVVADTVYGHSPDLRIFLEEQGDAYAVAVPCTEVVCVQTTAGCLLADVASIAQQALGAQDLRRLWGCTFSEIAARVCRTGCGANSQEFSLHPSRAWEISQEFSAEHSQHI